MLTTQIHLASRLRMSGAVPIFPLYAFMAWTGTTLPFTFLQHSSTRLDDTVLSPVLRAVKLLLACR